MSANLNLERNGDPGDVDGLDVTDLVTRARDGQERAWNAPVERYSPLIWSICRRYRLDGADAEDVSQIVWLRLVDHLGSIRDPAAPPGWLITTTRRECGRVLSAARGPYEAGYVLDAEDIHDDQAVSAIRRDQRQAGHRDGQYRAQPRPLPG
jgi:RNA polymerase sigma factor (sigma-70 family)